MAFAPLILTGDLEINGTDVSDQVMSFVIKASRESVEIPATLGTRKTFKAGNDSYEVEFNYLQDNDATALTQIFWTALADADGTITFGGTLRAGAVSATNPRWEGTAVVTGMGVGGEVNAVGDDSVTFPCTDRPTQAVT